MLIPTVVILGIVGHNCCTIKTLSELNAPILYIDRQTKRFLSIDGDSYRLGVPLYENNYPNVDVPQFAGQVKSCASLEFECKKISSYILMIPINGKNSLLHINGLLFSFENQKDGSVLVTATCPKNNDVIADAQHDCPSKTYQYEVDIQGVVKYIKVQNWNLQQVVSSYTLRLESSNGITLK